jgi:centromere/kinetochore protein ZW10
LTKHSKLLQEAADIEIRHKVLSHISSCKTELANVDALVASGQLSEAVAAIASLDTLLAAAPRALADSDIFLSFTVSFPHSPGFLGH